MDAAGHTRRVLRVGPFEVDPQAGELRKHGLKIKLQEQPFQVLVLLLEHPGEVVTREELRAKLWPADTFVDFDVAVNSAIKKIREALGDSANNPRFVETLPRRGYRFIAPVEDSTATLSGAASAKRGRLRKLWIPGLASAAILASLVGFNVGGWRDWLRGRSAPAPIRSLAVLPLENLSGDPEQEYFTDGLTEALTTDLAQVRALRVISRTSAMRYKGTKKSLPEIARELNVEALVEGAVARSGDRVRVTAQLIHARSDRHLWANSYERDLPDILVLQSEVARAITNQIRIQVTQQEQGRLTNIRSVQPEAYLAYLKGRYHWNRRTDADLKKAIEYFERPLPSIRRMRWHTQDWRTPTVRSDLRHTA